MLWGAPQGPGTALSAASEVTVALCVVPGGEEETNDGEVAESVTPYLCAIAGDYEESCVCMCFVFVVVSVCDPSICVTVCVYDSCSLCRTLYFLVCLRVCMVVTVWLCL